MFLWGKAADVESESICILANKCNNQNIESESICIWTRNCNNLSEDLLRWLPGRHCACHQCQEHQEQESLSFSSMVGRRKGPEEFLWDHQLLRTSSTRSWSFAQDKSFRCHRNFPHRGFGSRIWCQLNKEVQDTQDIALAPGNIFCQSCWIQNTFKSLWWKELPVVRDCSQRCDSLCWS